MTLINIWTIIRQLFAYSYLYFFKLTYFKPSVYCTKADFCGQPRWWFGNPIATPTPYETKDDCKSLGRFGVKFFHGNRYGTIEGDCVIDLAKPLDSNDP